MLEILSNSNNFDFNQKIEKNNELYHYYRIPILLYCIEKNAFKCFKFVLINGANPSIKSEKLNRRKKNIKEFGMHMDLQVPKGIFKLFEF